MKIEFTKVTTFNEHTDLLRPVAPSNIFDPSDWAWQGFEDYINARPYRAFGPTASKQASSRYWIGWEDARTASGELR